MILWQKASQHPPKPNATTKYFSWDIPSNATTTVRRKLPNCNNNTTTTPNKKRKLPERPSQYYTSLEVSVYRVSHLLVNMFWVDSDLAGPPS